MRPLRRILAPFAFLLLLSPASLRATRHQPLSPRFAEKIRVHGISDAGKLDDFLYRGSQPGKGALEQLRALGVDTIVDLRGERHRTWQKERLRAESLGMRFVHIPGSGWSPPTDEQVVRFFSLLRERPRRKIYIHCWLGSDRTGVFLAAYRIAFQGWEPEEAIREMYFFHFKGFWHPAMKAYIRNFPRRLATSPALAPFREAGRPPVSPEPSRRSDNSLVLPLRSSFASALPPAVALLSVEP